MPATAFWIWPLRFWEISPTGPFICEKIPDEIIEPNWPSWASSAAWPSSTCAFASFSCCSASSSCFVVSCRIFAFSSSILRPFKSTCTVLVTRPIVVTEATPFTRSIAGWNSSRTYSDSS